MVLFNFVILIFINNIVNNRSVWLSGGYSVEINFFESSV